MIITDLHSHFQGNTVQAEGLLKHSVDLCSSVLTPRGEEDPNLEIYAQNVAKSIQRRLLRDLVSFFGSIGRVAEVRRIEKELENKS